MANDLNDDFRERGFTIIHVLIDNPSGGDPTWEDAYTWATDWDNDGTLNPEGPLEFPVIADTDGQLWNIYTECPFTPQDQILDQGLLTVDDTCVISDLCSNCGYSDSHVRSVLNTILPSKWCGEAIP